MLLTGDRDLYQCAGDGVVVLYLKTGVKGVEEVDAAEVERRYGVPPALVAWHVNVTPAVSAVTSLGPQPVVDVTLL